jgi:hypothetical protein
MNSGRPTELSNADTPRLVQWLGVAGARRAWLVIGVLYVALVAGSGVLMFTRAFAEERWFRCSLIIVLTLLALILWLRIWVINWRSLQMDWPPLQAEETGVWGVGGPGIRQPGATGIFPRAKISDEDEPGGG